MSSHSLLQYLIRVRYTLGTGISHTLTHRQADSETPPTFSLGGLLPANMHEDVAGGGGGGCHVSMVTIPDVDTTIGAGWGREAAKTN